MKTNFCAFNNKDPNYDYARCDEISSETQNLKCCNNLIEEILKSKADEKVINTDHLEDFLSPRAKTQTRSRLPIYINSTEQYQNFETEHKHVSASYSDICDYRLPWHSTMLNTSNCLHNTEDSEFFKSAIKENNSVESSPNVSEVHSNESNDSACSDSASSTYVETIYACCLDYNAIEEGDLTVRVSDRILIIHDSGSAYVLVKHIKTQKCGYIPRVCILNVNKFLADLI